MTFFSFFAGEQHRRSGSVRRQRSCWHDQPTKKGHPIHRRALFCAVPRL